MISVNVIASGSKGNCTAFSTGKITILFDAGIGFDRIQQALNFQLPAACFITHEHGDHAKFSTIQELLKRGVDVFMTSGTAQALNLDSSHRLHLIEPVERYDLDEFKFFATATNHDATQPVMFSFGKVSDFNARYIVDTGDIPLQFTPTDYLLVEANFLEKQLLNSQIDSVQRDRIFNNHLSLEKLLHWLKRNSPFHPPKEIHLIHISKRHGDKDFFRQLVQNAVGFKTKVFAY